MNSSLLSTAWRPSFAMGLTSTLSRSTVAIDRREQHGHAVGRLDHLVPGCGAHEDQHAPALLSLGDPHLLARHEIAAVHLAGEGRDPGRVGARVGLGHRERDVEAAVEEWGQEPFFEAVAAVPEDRVEAEEADVHRAAPVHAGPGRGDLLLDDGRFEDPQAAAAVGGRDGHAHPVTLDDGVVELPGKLGVAVLALPVLVAEARAQLGDPLPDVIRERRPFEVHRLPSQRLAANITGAPRFLQSLDWIAYRHHYGSSSRVPLTSASVESSSALVAISRPSVAAGSFHGIAADHRHA